MRYQAAAWLTAVVLWNGLPAHAQEVAQTATPTVIRTETRLVLVDSVVTDKKGNYIGDLSQKNFKVYEDNKEQPITSFAYEADPSGPNGEQRRYLVLFFDNASVSTGDQINARNAAQKFVDANTGPNKFIAVANFSGTLTIAQNFTNDAERLKAVINGVKMSAVSTSGGGYGSGSGGGMPSLNGAATFGARTVLLGLRALAKGLEDVPGRKSVVMLTAGFPLNAELQSELTATISACNRSNVAVYPIDVRGLAAPGVSTPGMPGMPGGGRGSRGGGVPMALLGSPVGGSSPLHLASFANSFAAPAQARGGGASAGAGAGSTGSSGSSGSASRTGSTSSSSSSSGTSGSSSSSGSRSTSGSNSSGSTSSGGRTGSTGGGTYTAPNPSVNHNLYNTRSIVPPMSSLDGNQSVLYALAEGTGGFVIVNTNDLLGGMEKIAKEQNQYYILGYTPTQSAEGSCHTLHVKVDRGGSNVRSRSGYCNVRQVDLLAGKPAETQLESIAAGVSAGNITAPLQVPFFYEGANVARVNVAMEIPSGSFKFDKVKGKFHSEMNVLGVAYRPDGSVGAKFSDTVKRDFDNKAQVEEFSKKPLHYETQFDIATGQYNFKVVFSAGGENFGKLEKPLLIEPFDGKQFAVSSLALSNELRGADASMDAILVEDHVPMMAQGVQAVPSAVYRFKPTDRAGIYVEVFEPGLTDEKPPQVGVQIRVVDKKTGGEKMSSGTVSLASFVRPGNPLIPVLLRLPLQDLTAGSYRLDVTGLDSAGKSILRTTDFEVE